MINATRMNVFHDIRTFLRSPERPLAAKFDLAMVKWAEFAPEWRPGLAAGDIGKQGPLRCECFDLHEIHSFLRLSQRGYTQKHHEQTSGPQLNIHKFTVLFTWHRPFSI